MAVCLLLLFTALDFGSAMSSHRVSFLSAYLFHDELVVLMVIHHLLYREKAAFARAKCLDLGFFFETITYLLSGL